MVSNSVKIQKGGKKEEIQKKMLNYIFIKEDYYKN